MAAIVAVAISAMPCAAQESDLLRDRRAAFWGPVAGAHLGGPLRLAGALGIGHHVVTGIDGYGVRYLLAEGGLGGAKLVVGLAGGTVAVFSTVRIALLRTSTGVHALRPHQTFVGVEGRFTVAMLTFGAGQYWRVSDAAPGDASHFAATIGLWF